MTETPPADEPDTGREPDDDREDEGEAEEPAAHHLDGDRIRELVEREAAAAEAEPPLEVEQVFPDAPPQDPRARACQVCAGWGILRTGSAVDAQLTRPCWHCGGLGFEEAQLVGPPTPLVASDQLEEPAPPAEPAVAWAWPQAGR